MSHPAAGARLAALADQVRSISSSDETLMQPLSPPDAPDCHKLHLSLPHGDDRCLKPDEAPPPGDDAMRAFAQGRPAAAPRHDLWRRNIIVAFRQKPSAYFPKIRSRLSDGMRFELLHLLPLARERHRRRRMRRERHA